MNEQQITQLLDSVSSIHDQGEILLSCLGFTCGTVFFLFLFWLVYCWRAR